LERNERIGANPPQNSASLSLLFKKFKHQIWSGIF
jgi:hypothetical protein